jgi:hypothetical protein
MKRSATVAFNADTEESQGQAEFRPEPAPREVFVPTAEEREFGKRAFRLLTCIALDHMGTLLTGLGEFGRPTVITQLREGDGEGMFECEVQLTDEDDVPREDAVYLLRVESKICHNSLMCTTSLDLFGYYVQHKPSPDPDAPQAICCKKRLLAPVFMGSAVVVRMYPWAESGSKSGGMNRFETEFSAAVKNLRRTHGIQVCMVREVPTADLSDLWMGKVVSLFAKVCEYGKNRAMTSDDTDEYSRVVLFEGTGVSPVCIMQVRGDGEDDGVISVHKEFTRHDAAGPVFPRGSAVCRFECKPRLSVDHVFSALFDMLFEGLGSA